MVGNMSYDTSEQTLAGAFGHLGRITDCKVITDRDTGRPKGFAFITFDDPNAAMQAVQTMSGQNVDGRSVRVEMAKDSRGGGGGGGGGGGYGAPPGPPGPLRGVQ